MGMCFLSVAAGSGSPAFAPSLAQMPKALASMSQARLAGPGSGVQKSVIVTAVCQQLWSHFGKRGPRFEFAFTLLWVQCPS